LNTQTAPHGGENPDLERRLALVDDLRLVERVGDPVLTALTRLAQRITGASAAAVHVFDATVQHRIAATGAPLISEHIEETFCQLAVFGDESVVTTDATLDPRFAAPLALRGPQNLIRFFAAVPLRIGNNVAVGTICAFDPAPRELSPEQLAQLEDIAAVARAHLELLKVAADLGHAATLDPLTGATNRVIFDDRIARALARRRRNGTSVMVAMIDVDDFKALNDTHGHLTGDAALRWVARGLRDALRESDTVGRLGGDEFGLVAESDHADFAAMLERVRAVPAGFEVPLSFSVGMTLADDEDNVETLLRRADAAMYSEKRAKKEGRA
jgi:diguanylate cyclase (GGDEF)-like protein